MTWPNLSNGFALDVIADRAAPLPVPASDAEIARRIVRHGLADVLVWLGEEPGAKPTDLVHTLYVLAGSVVVTHPESVRVLKGVAL